jgi:ubiquinone/menaquinone biosynthesis C-methylase UbiE
MQETREAHVPSDADADAVRFMVGDACRLPSNLAPADAVLAANLICRLPDPKRFLNQLPRLVKQGGIVVLTTPFSWLEAWTKQKNWLGGCASTVAQH